MITNCCVFLLLLFDHYFRYYYCVLSTGNKQNKYEVSIAGCGSQKCSVMLAVHPKCGVILTVHPKCDVT